MPNISPGNKEAAEECSTARQRLNKVGCEEVGKDKMGVSKVVLGGT